MYEWKHYAMSQYCLQVIKMLDYFCQNDQVELDSFVHEGYGYNTHVDQGWIEILQENSLRYDK